MISAALLSSASPDWWTPPHILEASREALGGAIDLDPCTNDGRPNVPAREHFTRADDGLSRPWHGRVYMNPPYGREIGRWTAKAIAEAEAGRAEAVIALVPARTDTAWFRPLFRFPIAFLAGRLRFIDGSGRARDPAPFPSAVTLLKAEITAEDLARFRGAFGPLGAVVDGGRS